MHIAAGIGCKRPPRWLVIAVVSTIWWVPGPAFAAAGFDFSNIVSKARTQAQAAYQQPQQVPDAVAALNAQQWAKIQYKSASALWRGKKLPFEIQFFHPGYNYKYPVTIRVINKFGVGRLKFSRDKFDYPNAQIREQVPEDIGYAGLRVHFAINRPDYKDEVAVFLGASYFRGVGKDQVFGLSARGLAINTGTNNGEEFPQFREFWLREPAPDDKQLVVYALLDSPSIAGAYRFEIVPGEPTVMNVDARLFPRKKIAKLGVAPLTSMFMFGENSIRHYRDYRPEVHDSDGLLLHSESDEWLWRPLQNPRKLAINSFAGNNIAGYGLIQRDHDFDHYQDLQLAYHRRPSAWVTPRGDWGKGRVELVQIPSDSEMNDNIVAYWRPETPVTPKQPLHFEYQLRWQQQSAEPPGIGRAVATRIGKMPAQAGQPDEAREIVIDFDGGPLGRLPGTEPVDARVNINGGATLRDVRVQKNTETGGWRLRFAVVTPNDNKPLELRAYLVDANGDSLTQTWSYALPP